jgi:hypothetical protein
MTPRHRHAELVSASIPGRSQPDGVKPQSHRQIRPRQVLGLDQVDLPRSMPILQLLLTCDGARHVLKKLKANETIDGIFRRKPPALRLPVLPHPRQQVRRYANIQRPIMLARKDIDTGLFIHPTVHNKNRRHPELVSGSIPRPTTIRCVRAWMLKQVQHDDVWSAVRESRQEGVK